MGGVWFHMRVKAGVVGFDGNCSQIAGFTGVAVK
jgi:hypothetical protein